MVREYGFVHEGLVPDNPVQIIFQAADCIGSLFKRKPCANHPGWAHQERPGHQLATHILVCADHDGCAAHGIVNIVRAFRIDFPLGGIRWKEIPVMHLSIAGTRGPVPRNYPVSPVQVPVNQSGVTHAVQPCHDTFTVMERMRVDKVPNAFLGTACPEQVHPSTDKFDETLALLYSGIAISRAIISIGERSIVQVKVGVIRQFRLAILVQDPVVGINQKFAYIVGRHLAHRLVPGIVRRAIIARCGSHPMQAGTGATRICRGRGRSPRCHHVSGAAFKLSVNLEHPRICAHVLRSRRIAGSVYAIVLPEHAVVIGKGIHQ